jgi:hypothetical protein
MNNLFIRTLYEKPDATVPWYRDTITSDNADYAIIQNYTNLVTTVPGIVSYTANISLSPTTQERIMGYDQDLIDSETQTLLANVVPGAPTSGFHSLEIIMSYIEKKLQNPNFTQFNANIRAYNDSINANALTGFFRG